MIILAMFSAEGGVGRTTLAYHLGYMLSKLGCRVLMVDFDPQSSLTTAFLDEDAVAALWGQRGNWAEPQILDRAKTVADAVRPLGERSGDLSAISPVPVTDNMALLPGDPALSEFSDILAISWLPALAGDIGALRVTSAFDRMIRGAALDESADVVLIDLGSGMDPINRSALLSSDYIITILAAEPSSLRGLRSVGPRLRKLRDDWRDRTIPDSAPEIDAPRGALEPLGYVFVRSMMRMNRSSVHYEKWLKQIPDVYATAMLDERGAVPGGLSPEIASIRNYQSLTLLAQEARKPMFDLRPADGAIGATQNFVQRCYEDFRLLALEVAQRSGLRA